MSDISVVLACVGVGFVLIAILLVVAYGAKSSPATPLLETPDLERIVPWVDPAPVVQPDLSNPASLEPVVVKGVKTWNEAQLAVLIPDRFGAGPGLELLSEFVKPRTVAYFLTNREMPWDEYLGFPIVEAMIMLIQSRMITAPHADDLDEQRWRLTVRGATFVAQLTPDPIVCAAARKFL